MLLLKSLVKTTHSLYTFRSVQHSQSLKLHILRVLLSKNFSEESPIKKVSKKKRRISTSSEEETIPKSKQ